MLFGERLQGLLAEKGISVAELARRTGISRNTLYSYLRRNPQKLDPAVLKKLAEALDVDVYYFLGAEGASGPRAEENELWELRELLRRRPEMRTLFSLGREATPDQVRQTIAIIEALKKANEDAER